MIISKVKQYFIALTDIIVNVEYLNIDIGIPVRQLQLNYIMYFLEDTNFG